MFPNYYPQSPTYSHRSRASLPVQLPPSSMLSNKKLQNMNCILTHSQELGAIFLGDIISTMKHDLLLQNNITAILSCMPDQGLQNKFKNVSIKEKQEIQRKSIPAKDQPEYLISQHFDETFEFIENMRKGKKNILVHCHAGLSRSASIVIAYLMRKNKWEVNQALHYVKSKRQRIRPNHGFLTMLKQYEAKIIEKQATTNEQTIPQKSTVMNSPMKNSHLLAKSVDFRLYKYPLEHQNNTRIPNNNQKQNSEIGRYPNQPNKYYNRISNCQNKNPSYQPTTASTHNNNNLSHSLLSQKSTQSPSDNTIHNLKPLRLAKKVQSELVNNTSPKNQYNRMKFGLTFKNKIFSKTQNNNIKNPQNNIQKPQSSFHQQNNFQQRINNNSSSTRLPSPNLFSSFNNNNTINCSNHRNTFSDIRK